MEVSEETAKPRMSQIKRMRHYFLVGISAFTRLVKKPILTKEEEEQKGVLDQLTEIKLRLKTLLEGYELQTDFDMVEVYIHAITSVEKEYSHLLKKAKQLNIHRDYVLKD